MSQLSLDRHSPPFIGSQVHHTRLGLASTRTGHRTENAHS